MGKRIGNQTIQMDMKPSIEFTTSVVGPKEGAGPLSEYFDIILTDDTNGQDSFEKAESSMMNRAIVETISKAQLDDKDVNYIFGGDLLNQLTASHFAIRDIDIPFFGLYGACSTMTESLSLASLMVEAGFATNAIATTSSHFSSSERQFRFPLEYGAQRKVTSQWTVTGAGAMLVSNKKTKGKPVVTFITTGKVKDYDITDVNNMGAAMVPAAVDTLKAHFEDTGKQPTDYDLIATGDLGSVGGDLMVKLMKEYGYDISKNYIDCGDQIYIKDNTVCAGGSGCGCSAVVDCGYIYKEMLKKKFKKVLIMSTGALMSTTSSLQGESIPGIAHAVALEME